MKKEGWTLRFGNGLLSLAIIKKIFFQWNCDFLIYLVSSCRAKLYLLKNLEISSYTFQYVLLIILKFLAYADKPLLSMLGTLKKKNVLS